MIQRIQSIFIFLASSSLGSLFLNLMAFANFTEPNPSVPASADGFLNIYDDKILLIVTGIGIAISLITLFLFKKRPIQIRLTWAMMALSAVIIGLAIWQIKTISSVVELKPTGIGFIPIVLSIIFGFLAIRYIRKDELFVRSADRLR